MWSSALSRNKCIRTPLVEQSNPKSSLCVCRSARCTSLYNFLMWYAYLSPCWCGADFPLCIEDNWNNFSNSEMYNSVNNICKSQNFFFVTTAGQIMIFELFYNQQCSILHYCDLKSKINRKPSHSIYFSWQ